MEGRNIVIQERRMAPVMLSLLVGAVVGGIVGLMVAPQSGMETRRLIGEKSADVRHKAFQAVDNTRSKAQNAVTSVRNRLGRGTSSAQDAREETRILEDSIKRTYDL